MSVGQRSVSRLPLILEYLHPYSNWSKITMDHVEGCGWSMGHVHVIVAAWSLEEGCDLIKV